MKKIILLFYILGVIFLSVLYKPMLKYHPDGTAENVGHNFIFGEIMRYTVVDSMRMLVELIALTMITAALILFFRQE